MCLHYALFCLHLSACWVAQKVCSGVSVRWYGNNIFGQPNNKGWFHIIPWLFEKTYSRCFYNTFIFCRIFAIILPSKMICLTLLTTLWNWSGRYFSFLFYRRKLRLMTTGCTNDKMELESTSLDLPQYSAAAAAAANTLSDSMDCSLPGCSVHGIFQARVLEWGAIAFSHLSTLAGHFPEDTTSRNINKDSLRQLSN